MARLHRIRRAAARERAYVRRIPEHRFQRYERLDVAKVALRLHALDLSAAAIDVAHDVALIFVGGRHFDLHYRLQEYRTRIFHRILERKYAGHLKRHFRRVNFVE